MVRDARDAINPCCDVREKKDLDKSCESIYYACYKEGGYAGQAVVGPLCGYANRGSRPRQNRTRVEVGYEGKAGALGYVHLAIL